jgi:hypothetical protein
VIAIIADHGNSDMIVKDFAKKLFFRQAGAVRLQLPFHREPI